MPYNKVIVLDQQDQDLVMVDGSVLKAGEVKVIPIWWPQTAVQRLHNRLKEICAEVDTEVAAMEPRALMDKTSAELGARVSCDSRPLERNEAQAKRR